MKTLITARILSAIALAFAVGRSTGQSFPPPPRSIANIENGVSVHAAWNAPRKRRLLQKAAKSFRKTKIGEGKLEKALKKSGKKGFKKSGKKTLKKEKFQKNQSCECHAISERSERVDACFDNFATATFIPVETVEKVLDCSLSIEHLVWTMYPRCFLGLHSDPVTCDELYWSVEELHRCLETSEEDGQSIQVPFHGSDYCYYQTQEEATGCIHHVADHFDLFSVEEAATCDFNLAEFLQETCYSCDNEWDATVGHLCRAYEQCDTIVRSLNWCPRHFRSGNAPDVVGYLQTELGLESVMNAIYDGTIDVAEMIESLRAYKDFSNTNRWEWSRYLECMQGTLIGPADEDLCWSTGTDLVAMLDIHDNTCEELAFCDTVKGRVDWCLFDVYGLSLVDAIDIVQFQFILNGGTWEDVEYALQYLHGWKDAMEQYLEWARSTDNAKDIILTAAYDLLETFSDHEMASKIPKLDDIFDCLSSSFLGEMSPF